MIPGVTDREYYTNSFHVPVYFDIKAIDKINIEAPYHALTNAGHISLSLIHIFVYDGEELTGLPADQIVRRGITLVPEGRRVFPDLTVLENLKIGAYTRKDDLSQDIEWVYSLFPRLKERHWQPAGTLSGGEQQIDVYKRQILDSAVSLDARVGGAFPFEIVVTAESDVTEGSMQMELRGDYVGKLTLDMDFTRSESRQELPEGPASGDKVVALEELLQTGNLG